MGWRGGGLRAPKTNCNRNCRKFLKPPYLNTTYPTNALLSIKEIFNYNFAISAELGLAV